jgi:tRNA threonylcarbamoyladenosine biosynthesis protein TsaE
MPLLEKIPDGAFCHWLSLASLEETQAIGARLSSLVRPGDTLLLEGELGAGKTSMVQGFAKGLGIESVVTSPTFSLCNIHSRPGLELHHYDLYRIEDEERLLAIGFEESLESDAIVLIEWPRLGAAFYRGKLLLVQLEHQGEGRRLRCGWFSAQDLFNT